VPERPEKGDRKTRRLIFFVFLLNFGGGFRVLSEVREQMCFVEENEGGRGTL